jgi:hypothetical protein
VDNRGGGNGNIGTAIAAKATPDGYVLVFASGTTFTINPFIYKSLGFDPAKDFAPVIKFGAAPNVLVVHPSLPARTLAEFTQYAKGRTGELNYASAGNGSSMHLAAELYQKMTGTKMLHVPYVSPGAATRTRWQTARSSYFIWCPRLRSRCLPVTCARSPSSRRPARACCRMCRPPGKQAWRGSNRARGMPCSRLRNLEVDHRQAQSADQRSLNDPRFASGCRIWGDADGRHTG